MTILDKYERTKTNFSLINEHLVQQLAPLPPAKRKKVDRVNDTTLILLSVFAFEAFCWDCVHEVEKRSARRLCSHLVPAIKQAALLCGVSAQINPRIGELRCIMNVRNLYAHGAGRRSGLTEPRELPPKVLRRYLFEADECEGCHDCCDHCSRTDDDTEWWPTPYRPPSDGSFSPIGSYFLSMRDALLDGLGCRSATAV